MADEILCVDCKHGFMTWADKLIMSNKRYALRCKKAYKDPESDGNLVTGPTMKPAHFERCGIARLSSGVCGQEGKLWEPKHKKHLFLWIKKEA